MKKQRGNECIMLLNRLFNGVNFLLLDTEQNINLQQADVESSNYFKKLLEFFEGYF